jgi:gluconolactonase
MKQVAEGLEFPEGPVVLDDGSVLVVEIKRQTIARIDPSNGSVERVAQTGGGPNGAALGPDGKLYVCNNGGFQWHEANGLTLPGPQPDDYIGGRIQVVDLSSGEVSDLYTECSGNKLNGPNDIVFDSNGGFYFTDLGKNRVRESDTGVVYYAKMDGSEIVEFVFPMVNPNGIGLSPNEDKVYVAESLTSRIWGHPVASPGKLGAAPGGLFAAGAALVYTLVDYQLLDSLAIEENGNVAVATLVAGGVTVVSPEGELVEFVKVPSEDPLITNVAFGGPDMKTAYITSSGRGLLYEAEWARPGLKLNQAAAPA